jgi:hypothetical protein
VSHPSRGAGRVAVVLDPRVWREEIERLERWSGARIAAERERRKLEAERIDRALLERC